jgi:thiol-disulfide isomerase/thioredoxin
MNIMLFILLALALQGEPKDDLAANARKARTKAHHALLVEYFNDRSAGKSLRWEYFAPRFLREAEETPGDYVGFDALFWLSTQSGFDHPEFSKAMALLTRHHAKGNQIGRLCYWFVSPRYFATASNTVEALLREVIATNPDRDIQAEVCFSLAQYFVNKAEFVRLLGQPGSIDLERSLADRWGREYVSQLRACDADALSKEGSRLFNLGRETYTQYWETHLTFGKSVPEINGEDISGNFMALSDHRGKVVVLNFWGTGCLPCLAMFSQERSLVQRLAGKPFVLLGIVNDKDRAKAKKMVEDKGLTWRSWWDGEDVGSPIMMSWQVRFWPTIYVLDHRGTIRYRDIRGDDLDFAVDALLIAMREAKAVP